MHVLEARDVSFSYTIGEQTSSILKHTSLKVDAGEFVALKGPSGSGKSTLFYILGAMLRPKSGAIFFHGQDLSALSDEELAFFRSRHLGFVFQQFYLLPRASVLENILLPSHYPLETPRGLPAEAHAKAIRLSQRFGLEPFLHHGPQQLSGGQQQRVAIARALINNPSLILADEPTGNLDSKSAEEILRTFRELTAEGKSVLLITHDEEVAKRADRVIELRDGEVVEERVQQMVKSPAVAQSQNAARIENIDSSRGLWRSLPMSLKNIHRNRMKSMLTMVGVAIGVAAVMAMVSIGQYAKVKFREGFESMGVNKIELWGYPSVFFGATDKLTTIFWGFDWRKDLMGLQKVFPQVELISPVMDTDVELNFGGKSLKENVALMGVNEQFMEIIGGELAEGKTLNQLHVTERDAVCVIGQDIQKNLFDKVSPLGRSLAMQMEMKTSFSCRIIGVLAPQSGSAGSRMQSNSMILLPYTVFKGLVPVWRGNIYRISVKVASGHDVIQVGEGIKSYFESRYGKGGRFDMSSNLRMIAESKRFLNITTMLLIAMAVLSLLVGGIGIHNLMLVSVQDRIKEIGLRKAVGATDRSLFSQIIWESLLLCGLAGVVGLLVGFWSMEGLLWAGSQLNKNITFTWVIDPVAIVISLTAIVTVGILSGMVPARKARYLSVIEALRAE